MKKFFTLIAVALVAVSASAQDEYTNLGQQITNGNIAYNVKIKGGDFSQYPASKLTSFVSAEWLVNEESGELEKVQGTPRVTVDPADAANFENDEDGRNGLNYCIEVQTRLPEEGVSADPWDSRFYITLPINLLPGDKVKFSMKVMAKEAATISAQGHTTNDGNGYKVYRMANSFLSNVNVPAGEWFEYKVDEFVWADADEGVNTFAIDLGATGNVFYFDDISCEVQQKKLPDDYIDMSKIDWDNVNWINLVDNGNCAAETSYSLVCRESGKADYFNRVLGFGTDESYGVYVTSVNNASNPWDTQFFIYVNHVFSSGEKTKISFDYRCDVPATIPTQTHTTPGNYLGGGEGMVGSLSATPEWQHYEKVVNAVKGMSTLTFNLNQDQTLATSFYFDNVEMCIAEEAATAADKEEAAKVLAAKVEDTIATGINSAKAAKTAKTIYNVAGQQLKSLQKGLNIVNGEKVYVK